jgi:hypothetical protein
VACLFRVDAGISDVGFPQAGAQRRIVAAGRLHHDQAVARPQRSHPRPAKTSQDRIASVALAMRRVVSRHVVNVEMILRDIDSEGARV